MTTRRRITQTKYHIAFGLTLALLAIGVSSAAGAGSMTLSSSLSNGQTVSGTALWEVTPAGGTPTTVVFLVDGVSRWTERYAPFVFNGDGAELDSTQLSDGSHELQAIAYSGTTVAARSTVAVTVANATPATSSTVNRTDLARSGVATTSSVESPSYLAGAANDGNGATRWSSTFADNQWWQVDLGSTASVDTVAIDWEDAYAKTYRILVSNDGSSFAPVASEAISKAGTRTTTFQPVTARFIRVLGLTRGTPYGFSAWSIRVLGSGTAPVPVPPPSPAPTPSSDLAFGRPTSSSSVEQPDRYNGMGEFSAANTVDGDPSTRWSSNYADSQWWQADLGPSTSFDTVAINWEAAHAKDYKIQVSQDGTTFSDVASVSVSEPGWKTTVFSPVSARYVRVFGVTRATQYGFSAWDIRVSKSTTTGTVTAAPVSTKLPSITGTAQVAQAMQADPGTWTSSPTSFAYQWQRCDSAGQGCAPIASATSKSYAATTADVDRTLRVLVTAANAGGSVSATSPATSTVTAAVIPSATPSNLGGSLPNRLGSSTGSSYYVSNTSGSDSNPGTIDRPFGTIAKAWSVATGGTTVYVRAGTYGGQINLSNKAASASNPITVRAYGSERVLLSGPSAQDYPAVYIWRTTGVRLQGFEVANDAGDGIKVDSGWDVEIVGNDIHGNGMQGIIVGSGSGSSAPTYSKNVQIWSNRIHDNGGWWSNGDPYALVGTHGVYYGNTGSNSDGIQHGAVGGVVANNLFYDQRFGYHIQVGSQNDGLVITNNTFDGASQPDTRAGNAIQIYGEGNAFATKNVVVVNNIIANDANRGVYGSGGSMTSNLVRNNLSFNNPRGDIVPAYGSSTLFTVGQGNITADPKFVSRSSKQYTLDPSSPAIGRADAAFSPATDYYGNARSGAPDLGAVERVG